jgi:hypothetical protein
MQKISTEPNRDGLSIILSGPNAGSLVVERSIKLQSKLEAKRATLGYQTAYFRETFSDELYQAMEHRGLNQADFAKTADVPKQFLTKVFRGGNCTMDTIVKLAYALNYRAHIHLTPNHVGCGWIHWVPTTPRANIGLAHWFNQFSTVINTERKVEYAPVPADS